jgi:G protein beta subunit-like protein
LLVTTSADQTARIWKTSDFTLLQELRHEAQRWVWDVAFSADSQYLLTGNASRVILDMKSNPQKSGLRLIPILF